MAAPLLTLSWRICRYCFGFDHGRETVFPAVGTTDLVNVLVAVFVEEEYAKNILDAADGAIGIGSTSKCFFALFFGVV